MTTYSKEPFAPYRPKATDRPLFVGTKETSLEEMRFYAVATERIGNHEDNSTMAGQSRAILALLDTIDNLRVLAGIDSDE